MHARIVDVAHKPRVDRRASARGRLRVRSDTMRAIRDGTVAKGDVRSVATVAALQAVKRTPDWLPLCHPLSVTSVDVEWTLEDDDVVCTVQVGTTDRTGVEMEALTGVTAGLLTVWDMVKPLEKDDDGQYPHTRIHDVVVTRKDKGTA